MARKKKTEEVTEEVTEEIVKAEKPVSYGTGWTGKNNRIQAGLSPEEVKNE